MKILFKKIILIIRYFFSLLPRSFNCYISSKGLNLLAYQSEKNIYIRKIFDTDLKIIAQTNYAVERQATSIFKNSNDIYWGIKSLNLKNFTMLDIGANVGVYSLAAIYLGAKNVISIEPGPTHKKLVENIHLNNLNGKIKTYKIAFGLKKTLMRSYEDINNLGNSLLVNNISELNMKHTEAKFDNRFIEVEVDKLDYFYKKYKFGKIDLVKVDVEGMEFDVLKGGEQFITDNYPIIVAETFKNMNLFRNNKSTDHLFKYLYTHGYRSFEWSKYKFTEFKYPDLKYQDTFFIHQDYHSLKFNLTKNWTIFNK
jgi:FkbM family methyltransferase